MPSNVKDDAESARVVWSGRRLPLVRTARDSTQAEVGDATGPSREYLGGLEHGRHNPALRSRRRQLSATREN
jgi:transcriptional regulator with XRE-family HTH domain